MIVLGPCARERAGDDDEDGAGREGRERVRGPAAGLGHHFSQLRDAALPPQVYRFIFNVYRLIFKGSHTALSL